MNIGGGIAARIALAALVVAAIGVGVVAIGVLRVGAESFAALMVAAGDTADHAREMFDTSVTVVFGIALAIAAAVALVLAVFFARMLARPIQRVARAAERVAAGDLTTRVPEDGPTEVRALATAYNTMADRLEEQEMLRREFVVNASHELRTPLTNLQGYLEALRDGVLPPDPATFDSLREEVDRLGRLAASLDILAGAEGERAEPMPVDIGALVRGAADLAAPALSRQSIALAVDSPDGLMADVRADEIAQVMANLFQNAVRYTPSGGNVRVEATRTPEGSSFAWRIRESRSRPATSPGSGSASTAWISHATAHAAAPASASLSSASWSRARAGRSAWPRTVAGRRSG